MPFQITPLPPTLAAGNLVTSQPSLRLGTSHQIRFGDTQKVRIALDHSATASVKLAVEYLEPPYPLFEVQCLPQYRAYINRVAR